MAWPKKQRHISLFVYSEQGNAEGTDTQQVLFLGSVIMVFIKKIFFSYFYFLNILPFIFVIRKLI